MLRWECSKGSVEEAEGERREDKQKDFIHSASSVHACDPASDRLPSSPLVSAKSEGQGLGEHGAPLLWNNNRTEERLSRIPSFSSLSAGFSRVFVSLRWTKLDETGRDPDSKVAQSDC